MPPTRPGADLAAVEARLRAIHAHPELCAGLSPALAKRLPGEATFTFTAVDEALFAELETLVAGSFEAHIAAG